MSIHVLRPARSWALVIAVVLLAMGLAGTPAPAATECTSPPPIMPTDQLVAGMYGSGVTTLKGTTPTSFDVEVLGVLKDYIWLDVDAIVVRITGPQSFLDQVGGVFYGMSGSPVYVDGKLIGSVSYGVSYDPTIIGLTPAQSMTDLFGLQSASGPTSLPQRIPLDEPTRRAVARATGRSLGEVTGGLQLLPSYLGVSGLSAARLAELQQMLDDHGSPVQVVASSSMPAGLPVVAQRFTAGQPIGSVLSWGDFTIWAAGTVAVACGDEVVAYGHSLFWNPPGQITIGMVGAEVLAVGNGQGLWAGDMVPVLTEPRGTFGQDRFAGEAGFVGVAPPSIPITSSITSLDTGRSRDGLTESIYPDDYYLDYQVWGHNVLNFGAVQEGLGPGTTRLSYTIEGTREDGTPFTVSNRTMVASTYDATYSIYRLTSAVDQLFYNGFEEVSITSIDSDGAITADQLLRKISRVRTSSSLEPKLSSRDVIDAKPGDHVTVEVTLTSPEGVDSTTTFTVKVPRHASRSKVSLRGGREKWYGRNIDSFDALLAFLNGGQHPDDLVVSAFGHTTLRQQPVIVTGKASFTINVVR